nr:tetratricopeptide repeat protein [uncultured Desulfuromonas sp.]
MEHQKPKNVMKFTSSMIPVCRDLAVILAVVSSLIGFGPQLLDSVAKFVEAKRQHELFSAYRDYGVSLFNDEFYRESTRAFEEALTLQPHDIDTQVWLKKAKLLDALYQLYEIEPEKISQLSFEVEFVIRNSAHKPDIYLYYYVQGNIRYVLKNLNGARSSYEKALELKPDYGRALANLGAVLNDLNQHDDAIKLLHKALQADYVESSVYNNLVFGLHSAGRNQEAVTMANEGLKRFPTSAGIYNELGIALYRLGRMEESISALKMAKVMTPEQDVERFVQRLTNLTYPLADSGQFDEALSFLHSAQELAPENPHVYLALAHCHCRARNDLKALEAYERLGALGVYPDPDDLVKWAEILERVNRSGEADRVLHIAVDTWKGDNDVLRRIKALAIKLDNQALLNKVEAVTKNK